MNYPELQGKCAEYIREEKCLGCERLSMPNFTGDDNCKWIKEREQLEENYRKWRIR